jgi:hypothetical protein
LLISAFSYVSNAFLTVSTTMGSLTERVILIPC